MTTAVYWEEEEPIVEKTQHNTFRWYKQAARLHVCLPDYEGKGGPAAGKTVTINLDDIVGNNKLIDFFLGAFGIDLSAPWS